MTGTASRLLELLSLLQARRDWTGPELARRLEVSERTVRRDVDLVAQYSKSPCRFQSTWGYDRGGVWVDRGCAAEFVVY